MKFLLIKLNHLGDTLLLTPTIRFLRETYPDAVIDVMVRRGCETVLEGNPDISRLIAIGRSVNTATPVNRLREGWSRFQYILTQGYDFAFDLSHSDRAKLWTLLSRAKYRAINDAYHSVGWKRLLFNRFSYFQWGREHQVLRDFRTVTDALKVNATPGPLVLFPRANESSLKERFSFLQSGRPYAIIHPTSRWAYKQWLPERWAAVADRLAERMEVVFTSGPNEREIGHVRAILHLTKKPCFFTEGKTTLHELALLIQKARLFAGVDTVAMHIAAAMQTPIIALFGPSSEWSWRPWQCPHELALGECSCKKTRHFICDKNKPYPCMESISVADVCAKME
ncbi:MAG: putative lipopolysaccharide heptosyltransferase III, partial [bacterium]